MLKSFNVLMNEMIDAGGSSGDVDFNTPVSTDPTKSSADGAGNDFDPEMDTFDNLEYKKPEEEIKEKDKENREEAQTKNLPKKEAEETEEKKEEETKEEEKEETEEEKQKARDEKGKFKKMVQLRNEEGLSELDPAQEVKVKVDGKDVFVPMTELMSNYAGKTAWDKKFSELDTERRTFQQSRQQYDEGITQFKETAKGILDIINNESANPFEAVHKILELEGKSVVEFKKRAIQSMYEEIVNLSNMSDDQIDAYWARQELEEARNQKESLSKATASQQQKLTEEAHVSRLRETHKIDEATYQKSVEELRELGHKDLKPEQVIEFAKAKPIFEHAANLVDKGFSDQLDARESEQMIGEVAKLKIQIPSISDEDAVRIAAKTMGFSFMTEAEAKAQVAKKQQNKPTAKPYSPSKSKSSFESFDDFETY